ncbi:MAG: hypothetical protein ACFCU1_01305 [Sumerlaeia bacterium]
MKIFWSVVFYNLLAFGLFCLVLIIHPAQIKALITADLTQVASKTSTQVSQAVQDAVPDSAKPKPTPKPTPPPAKKESAFEKLKPAVEAVQMGDYLSPIQERVPPPEFYPFSVMKREILDDGSFSVDIFIQNNSGFHFLDASVILRSSDYPRPQNFTIKEWRTEEVALIKYKFPQSETKERLANLRVRVVRGDILDNPLSKSMRENREKLEQIQRDLTGGTDATIISGGDSDFDISTLEIVIPDDTKQVPFEMENRVVAKSEKDRLLVDAITEAHQSALEVQELMLKFVNDINNDGFQESMLKGNGLLLRDEIRTKRNQFSGLMSRVHFQQTRNTQSEVDFSKAMEELTSYTTTLIEFATLVDTQIPIDKYKLQNDTLTSF